MIRDSTKGYRYRFDGDNRSHEIYDPAVPNDLTFILTSLNFASGHPIRFSGRQIGQSLQSPRKLDNLDGKKLSIFASGLTRIG